MDPDDKAWLLGIVALVFVVAVLIGSVVITAVVADSTTRDELPRCREDQVLIGFGSFAHGQWEEYTCGYCPDCEHE